MNFYDDVGQHGQATALIAEDGARTTYAELAAAAASVGEHLKSGALVFLLGENNAESVIAYVGALGARAPVAMLAAGLQSGLLANLLDLYRPQYVWAPRERVADVPGATELFGLGNYVMLATDAEPPIVHEDLALLLTTSGSTGSPKFVRLSAKNIVANASSIAEYLDIGERDRAITTLPLHYAYGLSVINSHLLAGASIVLTGRSIAEKKFWDLLRAQKATSFAGVPYTYETLKRLRFARMAVPTLKVLTQAGGKLSPALVEELAGLCQDKGMRFYVMYGAVEATARMAFLPPERAIEKSQSVGRAIPGGELWIEDENGEIVQQSGVGGELVYRGENVTLGYACCREDLALGDERGGLLHTGDMAYRDEEGFFCITGRKSRFLKVFGNRVNLEEIEQHIRDQGIECACAGQDDMLRIYITDASRKESVTIFVQDLTRLHRSACQVVVIDRIPRNESGKITYAALP